eukprot:TRINITY_DN3505_c0_g1_i33.p2 TRINITY_DN3505_c0_g1~~TRINITY_DN3505_c0_g1_i33.p2  ORF type:complete len:225 (+),score=29.66 TRINITY_DN3505_c0_g1_i33:89-763(+)
MCIRDRSKNACNAYSNEAGNNFCTSFTSFTETKTSNKMNSFYSEHENSFLTKEPKTDYKKPRFQHSSPFAYTQSKIPYNVKSAKAITQPKTISNPNDDREVKEEDTQSKLSSYAKMQFAKKEQHFNKDIVNAYKKYLDNQVVYNFTAIPKEKVEQEISEDILNWYDYNPMYKFDHKEDFTPKVNWKNESRNKWHTKSPTSHYLNMNITKELKFADNVNAIPYKF